MLGGLTLFHAKLFWWEINASSVLSSALGQEVPFSVACSDLSDAMFDALAGRNHVSSTLWM